MPRSSWPRLSGRHGRQLVLKITFLGQSCFLFAQRKSNILIDPYFSDSVAKKHGRMFRRLTPAPVIDQLPEPDAILITHHHLDHADPFTLRELLRVWPEVSIFAPPKALSFLHQSGIHNLQLVTGKPFQIHPGITVFPIPAAHPEIQKNPRNQHQFVGYGITIGRHRIYHAGDTSLHPLVIQAARRYHPTHAILPINERNYYREKLGIIGNLTVREAFGLCEEIGARTLIPCHWDMFSVNSVCPREISAVYHSFHPRPSFRLKILRPFQSLRLS